MLKITTASCLLLLSTLSFSQAENSVYEAWKGFSDPEIMSSGFIHTFSELPSEGSVKMGQKNWSGYYWPSQKGGINFRWNSPGQEGFGYSSPTKSEVKSMSIEQLSKLSPTEKYDLFLGNYDYPLKKEASGTASRGAPDWAGICHGWAPATLHHNEPTPKLMKNPDGVVIPFGSSDIKALLSYYYAFYYESESTQQMGLRCFFGSWLGGRKGCSEDLNAGAFHIVIANKLGIDKEGFLGDVVRYKEVWNQPIVSFKSKIVDKYLKPSSASSRGTAKEMRIATELFYVDEPDLPTWDVVQGTKDQVISKKDLVYRIELNIEGKIIGGEWESEERPDFIWNKPKTPSFEGLLSRLPELLND